ncbi:MAG TPA: DUF2141 domain-containing protein [Sphingomicrobium sp.]|jgi:uncharacterized protein (DUF2141 family)
MFLALAAASAATLDIQLANLRNARGQIHACVSANPRFFPDCSKDPNARKQTLSATARELRIQGLKPGTYAVTLFHDENANQRLDVLLGIPREGFGFSRNPVVRFGAPKFEQVNIEIPPGYTRLAIRMQYLL